MKLFEVLFKNFMQDNYARLENVSSAQERIYWLHKKLSFSTCKAVSLKLPPDDVGSKLNPDVAKNPVKFLGLGVAPVVPGPTETHTIPVLL